MIKVKNEKSNENQNEIEDIHDQYKQRLVESESKLIEMSQLADQIEQNRNIQISETLETIAQKDQIIDRIKKEKEHMKFSLNEVIF